MVHLNPSLNPPSPADRRGGAAASQAQLHQAERDDPHSGTPLETVRMMPQPGVNRNCSELSALTVARVDLVAVEERRGARRGLRSQVLGSKGRLAWCAAFSG